MSSIHSRFLIAALLGTVAFTHAVASENEMAKEMARQDFRSTQEKIIQDDRVESARCAQYAGPPAKACQIQARAKREAAEEEARESFKRAGSEQPLRPQDKRSAAKAALAKAREARTQAMGHIKATDRAAEYECYKLRSKARKSCSKDVQKRTHEAQEQIEYRYWRDVERAKAISK